MQLFWANDKWNTKRSRFFIYIPRWYHNLFKTDWDYLDHIKQVIDQLRTANIKLKLSKYDFFKSQITYLGHLLSQAGILPLQEKLDAIRTIPPPQNIKELRQFPGLTGYYRNHINHYVNMTNSPTKLLKKDEP